jgi:hypothetical protein
MVFRTCNTETDNQTHYSQYVEMNVFLFVFSPKKIVFSQEQSHKSYRPLCVLTFRWNYAVHELDPVGYHLVNVILHGIVCVFYFR